MSAPSGTKGAARTGKGPDDVPERSYVEIEIGHGLLNLFERQGDLGTAELVSALARYGLRLVTRLSSPCG